MESRQPHRGRPTWGEKKCQLRHEKLDWPRAGENEAEVFKHDDSGILDMVETLHQTWGIEATLVRICA